MIQAPKSPNQRDEDMKLPRDTRETPSKQATSNKKQQEPIDEGAKNSPHHPLPHSHEPLLDHDSWIIFLWSWYLYRYRYLLIWLGKISVTHSSRSLGLDCWVDCEWVCWSMQTKRCSIVSSHRGALLLVVVGGGGVVGGLSRSIIWRNAIWKRLKDARRSRTRARSESSTSPMNHRPAIESSSSSTPLAWSMMEHIDGDVDAMWTCRQAIDWLQSHALDGLPRRRWDLDARRMPRSKEHDDRHKLRMRYRCHREWMLATDRCSSRRRWFDLGCRCTLHEDLWAGLVDCLPRRTRTRTSHRSTKILALDDSRYQRRWFDVDHHRSPCPLDSWTRQADILACRWRTRTRDRSTTRTPIDGWVSRRWWCDDDACLSQCLEDSWTRDLLILAGRYTTRTIGRSMTMLVLDGCRYQPRGCDHDRDR